MFIIFLLLASAMINVYLPEYHSVQSSLGAAGLYSFLLFVIMTVNTNSDCFINICASLQVNRV